MARKLTIAVTATPTAASTLLAFLPLTSVVCCAILVFPRECGALVSVALWKIGEGIVCGTFTAGVAFVETCTENMNTRYADAVDSFDTEFEDQYGVANISGMVPSAGAVFAGLLTLLWRPGGALPAGGGAPGILNEVAQGLRPHGGGGVVMVELLKG